MLNEKKKKKKNDPNFFGPYVVLEKTANNLYKLQSMETLIHERMLKKFKNLNKLVCYLSFFHISSSVNASMFCFVLFCFVLFWVLSMGRSISINSNIGLRRDRDGVSQERTTVV